MNETKIITGGMDSDNAIEYIAPTDFIEAYNFRPTGTDSQDAGYGNNIESTVEIPSTLPSGITKTIGAKSFETLRKLYEVRYNSNGNHQLVEIDSDSKTEQVLFENTLHTGGKDLLKLDPQSYFDDIRLVQDRWLILTDGYGEITCFDLVLLKNGYGRYLIANDIFLSKEMPLTVPLVNYGDDINYSVNNLRGKLFQFRTQFKYGGNMFSAHSPISKRPTPSNEGSSALGQTVTRDNYLKVDVQVGTESTDRLIVSMRYNEANFWVIVKDLSMTYIRDLVGNVINPINGITETFDPITNTYSFLFYNDGSYTPIDVNETDLPYDAVPRTAQSVEVINGNVLAVAGIEEGYDRPTNVDVDLSVTNYKINIGTNVIGGGGFGVSGSYKKIFNRDGRIHYENYLSFNSSPATAGDLITVVMVKEDNPLVTFTALSHIVTSGEAINRPLLYQNLANEIVGGNIALSWVLSDGIRFDTQHVYDYSYRIKSATISLVNIGTIDSKSYNVLKGGSLYQTALAYYDSKGRYFPLVTDESFKVRTTPIAESEGLTSQINWIINSKPPEGAVAYEWLVTENLKMANYVTLTGKYDAGLSATGDFIVIEIPSLQRFIDSNKGVVSYQFTDGDRATLIKTTNGVVPDAIKWFKLPAVELDVISFETEVDDNDNTVKYYLKLRKSSNLNIADIEGKEVELEIYSPRPIGDEKTSLFYGIGEIFPIVNGEHSVLSGTIREGDAFLKGRIYESTITPNTAIPYIVEDANFSDSYRSKFYSYGRARNYYDEIGKVNKKGSIRYSDVSVLGGQYNGLNRFYLGRIYGEGAGETTSKYGVINKIEIRDNYLIVIHELKVGHIPIYLAIIEDNEGNLQVADSAKLFGTVRYLAGNYGTGTAKNSVSVSKTGSVYFVDSNNNVIVRDGYDGVRVINGTKNKWFNERIKQAKASGDRIITYYNDFYNELNVTFLSQGGEVYQFRFNTTNWSIQDTFSVLPSEISITDVNNGTVAYDSITGNATFTPDLDFIGKASYTVNFQGHSKKVFIYYTEGDVDPNPFYFKSEIEAVQNVWVESNEINILGTNTGSPISVTGGEYRINGGVWMSSAGIINPEDSLQLRVKTSMAISTTTTATVTIGSVSAPFNVTTYSELLSGYVIVNLGYEEVLPRVGNYKKFKPVITLTEAINDPFNYWATYFYTTNGQPLSAEYIGEIPAGEVISNWTSYIENVDVTTTELIVDPQTLNPPNGSIVTKFGSTDKYKLKITTG